MSHSTSSSKSLKNDTLDKTLVVHQKFSSLHTKIFLVLGVILYLSTFSLQTFLTYVVFHDIKTLRYYILCGLIAQLHVMLSVFFVLFAKKTGYITAISLTLLASLFISRSLLQGNLAAAPGVTSYLGTFITSTIIYSLFKKINSNLSELTEQRNELLTLYKKVSASEDTLNRQNQKLALYNRILSEKENALHTLAYYDHLTGLPNRQLLIDTLEYLLQEREESGKELSVVFIDLNNFKKINDSMGHPVGDSLLKEIAQRWSPIIHRKDILGRLGGDEFALFITEDLTLTEIELYVETLYHELSLPFYYNNKELYLSASFGISQYPRDGKDVYNLLKCADMAMYKAKRTTKSGIEFFTADIQATALKRLEVESLLRNVLKNDELYLEYQPQFSLTTQKLRGFEALVRWQSPLLGGISPLQFISVAEETGDIISIGKWVLKTACTHYLRMEKHFEDKPILSVNFSVIQLNDPFFVAMIKDILNTTGFDPHYLELEVTESIFISSTDYAKNILAELSALGIRIAIDDFGTGYSSLGYLHELPIDTLKIDKSFIDHVSEDSNTSKMVDAIIKLSHTLGLQVIAEGVEDEAQLTFLQQCECDVIQGYIWGKPCPIDRLIKYAPQCHAPQK